MVLALNSLELHIILSVSFLSDSDWQRSSKIPRFQRGAGESDSGRSGLFSLTGCFCYTECRPACQMLESLLTSCRTTPANACFVSLRGGRGLTEFGEASVTVQIKFKGSLRSVLCTRPDTSDVEPSKLYLAQVCWCKSIFLLAELDPVKMTPSHVSFLSRRLDL